MNNGLLMIVAAGIILNAVLLYVIINAATHADRRRKLDEAKVWLLINIALKQGVEPDVIDGIKNMAKI